VLKLNLQEVKNAQISLLEDRLVFKIICGHDVVKVHSFTYEEIEPSKALFSTEDCMNKITINVKSIHSLLSHFPTSVSDINLDFTRYTFVISTACGSDNYSTNVNMDIQEVFF
jgi:hypothetical protein